MPPAGYNVLTFPEDFVQYLREEAKKLDMSPQRLVEEKFSWSRKKP